MAYGRGVPWTKDRIDRLRELVLDGETGLDISEILSDEWKVAISTASVNDAKQRYKLTNFIEKEPGIKIYEHKRIPMDNYMISCDDHAPFYSELLENRYVALARKFNIKKQVKVGDLFDFDFAKAHKVTDGEKQLGLDAEAEYSNPLMAIFDWFDKTYLVCGNHETRLSRLFDAKIQFRHIASYLGVNLTEQKFVFTIYDKLEIGTNWLLVHPKSYSQIGGSTAVRLAEKYHKNILNAHGHFIALRYDRSAKYMGIDLGCMLDQRKIAYARLNTTTHPEWNQGFGMLLGGHFYHFHDATDWSFWLKEK